MREGVGFGWLTVKIRSGPRALQPDKTVDTSAASPVPWSCSVRGNLGPLGSPRVVSLQTGSPAVSDGHRSSVVRRGSARWVAHSCTRTRWLNVQSGHSELMHSGSAAVGLRCHACLQLVEASCAHLGRHSEKEEGIRHYKPKSFMPEPCGAFLAVFPLSPRLSPFLHSSLGPRDLYILMYLGLSFDNN